MGQRQLLLIVLHDDKPEGQARDSRTFPFFYPDNGLDVFQHVLEVPAFSVLAIGFLRRSINAEHQAVKTGIDEPTCRCLVEFHMAVGAGMDHDIFGFGIGDHFEQIRIQEGLAPIPEHDQEQVIAHIIDEILESVKREQAGGPRRRLRRRQAQGARKVTEIRRLDLGDDRVPQRPWRQKKLVESGQKKVMDFLGGKTFDLERNSLEFEFQPAPDEDVRQLRKDIPEFEYLHLIGHLNRRSRANG